ncbi:hypothetical protein ACJBTM_10465, partial [Streptococcus suis]
MACNDSGHQAAYRIERISRAIKNRFLYRADASALRIVVMRRAFITPFRMNMELIGELRIWVDGLI